MSSLPFILSSTEADTVLSFPDVVAAVAAAAAAAAVPVVNPAATSAATPATAEIALSKMPPLLHGVVSSV